MDSFKKENDKPLEEPCPNTKFSKKKKKKKKLKKKFKK